MSEKEWQTRQQRIDRRLAEQGWTIVPYRAGAKAGFYRRHAVTEYPTDAGPADYALFVDGRPVGVIEAKKVALAPQNVLEQASRYARAFPGTAFNADGYRVPFLYATNGEGIWFRDVTRARSRSRV